MNTTIHIDETLEYCIKELISGTETVSQFCFKATEERVNRMEARSERARLQMMEKDKSIIEPIIIDVLKRQGIIK